ncbi:hypothetical protein HYDPIDRAFT_42730 [Hydnomerulius pinastri MD-312]|uniref:PH domain-containing protein n=1 Tax=Hydnomerulius pinastri MD-312 TaxID=994086 RepID=A0A0C9W4F6_9AGAM|nr:hypothetical protein HYDPIDRAFT_42730 [Hydnomerulius pinastri MD-312]
MSSTDDVMSTVFSMHSRSQPMSRTSTQNTEPLPTPMDERRALRAPKSGVGGPRKMDLGYSARPQIGVRTSTYESSARENPVGYAGDVESEDPEWHGPYFSIDQVLEPGRGASVRRRHSAKQLINRFESMTREAATAQVRRPPSSARAASEVDTREAHRPFLTIAPYKNKRRSLSNSLRNFMSVFKKRKDRDQDDEDEFTLPRRTPEFDDVQIARDPSPPPKPEMFSRPSERDLGLSRSKASALLSGPLLYLSRPSSPLASPILPVWTSCTVTLHDSHLLITWYTMHGNPSSKIISLDGCTDVRSLALKHMDPDERALLPTKSVSGDLKTFELLFEGRSREKFAAVSSQDRAQWVSAIWDAVLGSQDRREAVYVVTRTHESSQVLTVQTDIPPQSEVRHDQLLQPPSASEYTGSDYTSSSAIERTTVDTKLLSPPPTPIPKSPRHTSTPISSSPISLSPPRPPSQLSISSSKSHSRSKSPSIANLGSLSVVTQRLAQISRTESASSTPTALTTSTALPALQRAAAVRSQSPTTTRSTRVREAFAEIEKMQEESGRMSTFVVTPSTESSLIIPLPLPVPAPPPPLSLSVTAPARSRCGFGLGRMRLPLAPAPPRSRLPVPLSISAARTKVVLARTQAAPGQPIAPPALRTRLSEPAIREHVENPPASPLAVGITPSMAPLAELIKDSAAKHYDQTAGLGEQIIALQRDIHNLPQELQPTIAGMLRAEGRNAEEGVQGVRDVLSRLEEIRGQTSTGSGEAQIDAVVSMLGGLQAQLGRQMPRVMEKLASIEQGQINLSRDREDERLAQSPTSSTRTRAMRNLEPSSPRAQSLGDKSPSMAAVDLSDIYAKLDDLAILYRSGGTPQPSSSPTAEGRSHDIPPHAQQAQTSHAKSEKLEEILGYLQTDEEQRKVQLDQQADSVRYLNELNSWLDAFVNNGTAQIQTVAQGIEQLCTHLGVPSSADGETPPVPGMLTEIKNLVSSVKAKAENDERLQVGIGELVGAVQDHLKNGDEQRNALVTDSVLEIINRQRHDQEQMLRALSSELTEEIRGERLRFVEAMKEATAINVQAHVEHFKAELGREVAVMTQDVGRLHQEKQAIEQQIADLFAFYSKQKQEAENNARRGHGHGAPPRSIGFGNLQNLPASGGRPARRPLPHPVFQGRQ